MDLSTNPNTRWMSIFVDELARNGLEAVCISPGSRSTPLTLAFANQQGVRIYRHLDERSAGFFALGLAMASGRPVAMVCTSGTAAANFHPAVIEAYYSHVPLLVLTADRPAELRGSGANQTIDQIKMYGDHVRWSVDLPVPENSTPDVVIRHMRTLAARAYATANGLVKGPVHLNFPFRKPLEPDTTSFAKPAAKVPVLPEDSRAYTRQSRGRLLPETHQVEEFATTLMANGRGMIICGPECPGGSFPTAVTELAQRCGYPILADPLSGLRHGAHVSSGVVLGGYHLWLPAMNEGLKSTGFILRFGSAPTSNALAAYLNESAPAAHYHVREDGEWADDLHLTHTYIQADPAAFCQAITDKLTDAGYQPQTDWMAEFVAREAQAWKRMSFALEQTAFFDGSAVQAVLAALPDDAILFAGNSMPVRHVDTFDRPTVKKLTICGNRGASGIDGNVSTALGISAATGRPVVAILGDITFYHDMNGLLAIRQHGLDNVFFVVLNNDGGSIFHRLPVANLDPPFTDLFLTPHGLSFEHAAALYGLRYAAVTDRHGLSQQLDGLFSGPGRPQLIEIKTQSASDYRLMLALSNTGTISPTAK